MNSISSQKVPVDSSCHAHRALLIETFHRVPGNNLPARLIAQNIKIVEYLESADELLAKIQSHNPDVLILSVDFLDAATLAKLIQVRQATPLPVVVFANQHAPEVVKIVVAAGVSSYVVDDVTGQRLAVIIDLAVERFLQVQALSTELRQTKEKLSERKLVERAKGLIMKQKNLSEEQAYAQMRKSSMDQGQSMADLAKRIISVFGMLD